MIREFVELPIFRAKWKSLGLDDSDLRRHQLEENANGGQNNGSI